MMPDRKLKARLNEKGLKARFVARRLGVSDSVMSQWLNGKRDVPSRFVSPLAKILDVPIEDVLPKTGGEADSVSDFNYGKGLESDKAT